MNLWRGQGGCKMGVNITINIRSSGKLDLYTLASSLRALMLNTTKADTFVRINEITMENQHILLPGLRRSIRELNVKQNRNRSVSNIRK
ncbi:MAG: hypothetical protein ACTSWR_08235 [Candidatus Helarchaeota archaeon]